MEKELSANEPCKICHIGGGKYTCPRCNILYCSLACYKSETHAQCSEQFYQQCVQEELAGMEGGTEARKKMEEILQKVHKMNSDEDEEFETDSDDDVEEDDDLAERLQGVDLDDTDEVWKRLSESEKRQFSLMMSTGQIVEAVPEWEPWWITRENLPPLASDIPLISNLTSKPPSSCLPYFVVNSVIAYQIALRRIRGQRDLLCVEAATAIWSLSAALRETHIQCSSMDDVLDLIICDVSKCKWLEDLPSKDNIIQDLQAIPDSVYVLLALSDMKTLFDDAVEHVEATKKFPRFTGPPPKISQLKMVSKKLTFYLAWTKNLDDDEWDRIVGKKSPIVELD